MLLTLGKKLVNYFNYQIHKNAFKLLFCKNSLGEDMHSHERLLVHFEIR